ncbi:WD repeat-containing 49, partial [Paramuricea clavata]
MEKPLPEGKPSQIDGAKNGEKQPDGYKQLSYKNSANVTSFGKLKLLSRLTIQELRAIQRSFPIILLDTVELKRDIEQFCELLSSIVIDGNKAEFRELFDTIDTDKEGFVDWDKFCSHMQRDYQEKDDRLKTTQVPQWREMKNINSPHKESIQKITMLMNPPRYVTVSKEGVAVIWNLNMKPFRTIRVTTEPDGVKQRDLWITDFVPMQNIYKLVLAMTSKEIAIYDLSSKSEFLCQYRIRGLKSTPISLNFWSNPEQPNESILVFGDVAGCVNALIFCESTISLFDRSAQASSNQQDITLIVDIGDIAKGHYKNCRFAFHEGHTEWTRQVMYTGVLDCFISCATNYKNALVLGWMEKTKSTMRTTVFKISQGVNAFDYNEKLNLI